MRLAALLTLFLIGGCLEARAQSLGEDAPTGGVGGNGGMGDGAIGGGFTVPAGAATTGIDGLPIALTINGATESAPLVDYRGKDASAGGWPCTSTSSGAACPTLTKDGSTAAMTYGEAGGTGTATDLAVDFNGTGVDTQEHFDGDASTADVTTGDVVVETLVRVDSTANLGFLAAKASGTAGYRWFFGAVPQWDPGLKTASTWTDYQSPGGHPRAGVWEFCTICIDRSSATGATWFCNGQFTMYERDFSARSGSLANATIFSLGGDHETASRRVFNGRVSLYRQWDRDAWFSAASTSECQEIHRDRLHDVVSPTKRYLFLGDSITGNRIIASAQNPVTQYPRLYSDNATQLIGSVNAGEPSLRCDEIDASSWEDEKARGWARVYLMCGINDIAADASAAMIEARISAIVTEAKAQGSTVVVLTISPFKNAAWWTAPRQAVADAVNAWIMAGSAGSDYEVDVYEALDLDDDDDLDVAFDYGDGVHPTQAAAQAITDAVTAVISP